jgi:hypothetical protein
MKLEPGFRPVIDASGACHGFTLKTARGFRAFDADCREFAKVFRRGEEAIAAIKAASALFLLRQKRPAAEEPEDDDDEIDYDPPEE